jgi:CheY-like chemotaxis protein
MRSYPLTILCIDDDIDDIECFRDALETVDATCVCLAASTAKEGLCYLETAVPDVIFLDINMPVVDGHEILISIRKVKSLASVPVYMLSTSIGRDELDGFKKEGATGGYRKPETFLGLCEILSGVLTGMKNDL